MHSSDDMNMQVGVEKVSAVCHAGKKTEVLMVSNSKDATHTEVKSHGKVIDVFNINNA